MSDGPVPGAAATPTAGPPSPDAGTSEALTPARRRRLPWPATLRRPMAWVGAAIIAAWVLIALLAPLVVADPLAQDAARLQPPGPGHPFGTDQLGRDVLARTLMAARTSLPLAVLLVLAAMIIGGTLGAVAGYLGSVVDEVIMRLADIVFAFPTVILAMVVAAALGPSLQHAVIAMLVVTWPSYARVMRSLLLGQRSREYVVVGRLLGVSPWRSLLRDVLPNVIAPLIVLAALDVGTAILLLSGLGFLGLGALPPAPDWGLMISDGVQNLSAWWMSVFPGLAILTIVLAFNFLGDALRDALDPRTAENLQERAL